MNSDHVVEFVRPNARNRAYQRQHHRAHDRVVEYEKKVFYIYMYEKYKAGYTAESHNQPAGDAADFPEPWREPESLPYS